MYGKITEFGVGVEKKKHTHLLVTDNFVNVHC